MTPKDNWPDEVPRYMPIKGWMRRGILLDQKEQGWWVLIEPEPPTPDALPVTITPGHGK